MDRTEIFEHWRNWATTYGTELNATTKTPTLKMIEIDALARRIAAVGFGDTPARVLEVGCGNGANCIGLAQVFPKLKIDGIDYVPEMVDAATKKAAAAGLGDRLTFRVGNALEVEADKNLAPAYDVVFTDRCLINLEALDLQLKAMTGLAAKVRPGGHLLMIENSTETYNRQNHYRELIGLPARAPASYNLFFDETKILPHLEKLGLSVTTEDLISLHDLVLYVLVPAINGGTVDYSHPLVEAATRLNIAVSAETPSAFGACGQNRLFICKKPG